PACPQRSDPCHPWAQLLIPAVPRLLIPTVEVVIPQEPSNDQGRCRIKPAVLGLGLFPGLRLSLEQGNVPSAELVINGLSGQGNALTAVQVIDHLVDQDEILVGRQITRRRGSLGRRWTGSEGCQPGSGVSMGSRDCSLLRRQQDSRIGPHAADDGGQRG